MFEIFEDPLSKRCANCRHIIIDDKAIWCSEKCKAEYEKRNCGRDTWDYYHPSVFYNRIDLLIIGIIFGLAIILGITGGLMGGLGARC
jgi:hypothetical protein